MASLADIVRHANGVNVNVVFTPSFSFSPDSTDKEIYDNITYLFCNNQELTSLPYLPLVTDLWCSNNKLTSLPELPSVKYLICDNNQLTSLPASLPNIFELRCQSNKLTSIPRYESLVYLWCGWNNIEMITTGLNLHWIDCTNNPLSNMVIGRAPVGYILQKY